MAVASGLTLYNLSVLLLPSCLRTSCISQIPAVVVDIQVTGSANIITFNNYYAGSIPMQLVNDTEFTVEFRQDGM